MNETLSIVMTTDQNYILQTRVAIWTMLNAAKKDAFFKIYILCSPQLKHAYRNKIWDLQQLWSNVEINFCEIDDKIFQGARTTAYIPVASFYRLVICSVVEDDRCLFLDGDIIVNTDLSELYNTDLSDLYLAGVRDCCIQHDMKKQSSYKDILKISSMDDYINAGVLLMNLKQLREDDMETKFLSCVEDHYKMMDQDIMNKCCYGKIKCLDLKYNFFADFYDRLEVLNHTSFSQKEISDALNYDGIIHYPGKYKPWNFIRMRGSCLWWDNAKNALVEEDYDEIYKCAVENAWKTDWKYAVERCCTAEEIIIIGFSEIGKDTADSLERCGIGSIKCFCDNSVEKQKMQYHKLTVYSVDEAYKKYPKALWINTSQNSANTINNQLMSAGIKREDIMVYVYKTEQYYDNLDEQYLEYERKQLLFKQSGEKY